MKIAVVGSGPAGIFTCLQLADFRGEIHLFEQNKQVGLKLERTGGGRMNVTNKVFSAKEFSSTQPNLLKKLFKNPWVKNRFQLFDEMGVEYDWEGDRAILKSQDAVKEVARLNEMLKKQQNLKIQLNSEVIGLKKEGDQFELTYRLNGVDKKALFDSVVLTGGGMFRIGRPSDLELIYRLPLTMGHDITGVTPSLSSLVIKQNPLREFSGISLKAELTDVASGKKRADDMLIAHHGFSGPLALDFSSVLSGDKITLNLLPDIKEEDFITQFNALRQGKHLARGFLRQFLPKRLADWHLKKAEIREDQFIADVSKDTFKKLRKNLYRMEFQGVSTLGYSACWTTRGGVDLTQVNVARLESKLHKNLYFAGEILDVNGLCGGYNISFAAISARIVAEAVMS